LIPKIFFILGFLIFSIFIFSSANIISSEEIAKKISASIHQKSDSRFHAAISELYRLNSNQPFWIGTKNAKQFNEILNAIRNPLNNYKNKNFNHSRIASLVFGLDKGTFPDEKRVSALAEIDVTLTDSFLQLLEFIRVGDVDWKLVKQKLLRLKEEQDVHAVWEINPKPELPQISDLYNVLTKGNILDYLNSQLPLERHYRSLISMLQKYKKMPKFPKLHEGKRLKKGDSDDRIVQIKEMLKYFGDYQNGGSADSFFDRQFSKAVRNFRIRFKLSPGNFIDNKMIHYLNMTKNEYISAIIVNLDKLKLYPHSFEPTFVEVNVPEFSMRFYQNGSQIFKSDVVVGRIDRPTPIFNSKLTYMVLNPTWTIPDNLVRRDLIPMLKKNPSYLSEHNIHVFTSYKQNAAESELDFEKLFVYQYNDKPIPYRFVQFPSEKNALGRVKFMFPNKYSVYLHDTDNKKLFVYRYRVFSSGCMRLKKPLEFMHLLLNFTKSSYTEEKINKIFESNKPTTILLKRPIPIHIVYFTARKIEGREYFLYDIYLHDQIIRESTAGNIKATFTVPSKRLDPLRKKKKRKSFYSF